MKSPWKHCDQGFQQLLFANIKRLCLSIPVPPCNYVCIITDRSLFCLQRPHHSVCKILQKSRTILISSHLHGFVECQLKPYNLANLICHVAFFVFINQHWDRVTITHRVSARFCLWVTISYSFGLSDHSGCSSFRCECLHSVGCCKQCPWVTFTLFEDSKYVFFFFLHDYSAMYTYPHIDIQTHRHTCAYTGTCIHLHTHMVAFILSTPQSASCGTTCLGWERGGPETNRMSRGVWTVTVLRDTFMQDSAMCGHKKFKSKHKKVWYGIVKEVKKVMTGAFSILIVFYFCFHVCLCVGALLFHNYMPACLKGFCKGPLKTYFLNRLLVINSYRSYIKNSISGQS